jgi:DNA-binding beta-propeller fold protein YncE
MTYSDLSRSTFDAHGTPVGTHLIGWQARFFVAVLAVAILAVIPPPHAAAISDAEELTQFGSSGSGAGQLSGPQGIAADPTTGHVYIAEGEQGNRISVFTPWGNFVKAFGWDVAPGAVNEQQEVRVRASEGQFKLTFGEPPSSTPDLAFDAPGSESEGPGSVEAALNALPSIGGAGGSVSVSAVPGTPNGITPFIYVVTFKGSLAATNVAQLSVSNGTTPLSGGVPSTTLEARTRADGTAGGTGLESCTEESGCKAGLQGAGAGQFSQAAGVAVDAAGNIFVRERQTNGGNNRVQKFDSAGRFLLMFGGEVNKTKSAEVGTSEAERNRCTKAQLEGGDVCGIGTAGAGQGQFGASGASDIALGSSGQLFVGDVERIQRFNSEGEYQASVPVSGKTAYRLAVAPGSGDLYAVLGSPSGTERDVHRLNSATGAEIGKPFPFGQGGIATDPAGNVYTPGQIGGSGKEAVLQYSSGGEPLTPPSCCTPPPQPDPEFPPFRILSLGTNTIGTLYVAYSGGFIRSFGPGPVSFEAAPKVPPTITAQWASSVERTGAVLKAEINPHFWSDTRFYVEYGTGKCSEGGCDQAKPVPPGAILSTKTVDAPLQSAGIFLEGLQPGTTYNYRFVAQSGGGGPVRGVGGEVGVDGEESTFVTYPTPTPFKADCPNQQFRVGFSAPLANCRAFEMVSPIDKNNGDIKALLDAPGFKNAFNQSSTSGDRFTYSSYRAFGNSQAAPYTNQYLASREDGVGWLNEALSSPRRAKLTAEALENPYKAFSPDLCRAWLRSESTLVPASEGFEFYKRDNCSGEGYEALVQAEPSTGSPYLQGTSATGDEAIFQINVSADDFRAFYASNGELYPICILPNGMPSVGNCSGGTDFVAHQPPYRERHASVSYAISADGSRVYWTDSGSDLAQGKVYLRLNPGAEQSEVSGGECTEPEKACTVKVSETVSTKKAGFLGASADGSKALFEVTEGNLAGNLYMFDLETASSTLLAGEGVGVAAASEDLSHVYFASYEELPETSGATAGKPNLYLEQEGAKTFIATLSDADVTEMPQEDGVSNTSRVPVYHAARATPDGSHLAFISTESLTGYDNTDQATGNADSEVFLYEAGTEELVCVSCNPSGARPRGHLVKVNSAGLVEAAAMIPPPLFQLNHLHVLSDDGDRLFLNAYDALLPRDTNGKADVYQWEAASGPQGCEEKGAELYVASSGGCLSLISSGESPSDSEFLDASANGDDVFFTTNASLLSQDPGLIDVYDARVNGGFPAPPSPPGPCQGEACLTAPPPPNDPTPASASFRGAGNAVAKKAKARCAKGKARRKGRCVARRQKPAKKSNRARNANHDRRTQR